MRLQEDETGQDIVEYGMLAALISIAALVTIRTIGPLVQQFWVTILDAIN